MEKHTPQIHDYLVPDQWGVGEWLKPSDGFSDSSFPGCQFRVPSSQYPYYELAINLKVTGKPHTIYVNNRQSYKSRVKVEFVGDGEPSTYSGGWLYHN